MLYICYSTLEKVLSVTKLCSLLGVSNTGDW